MNAGIARPSLRRMRGPKVLKMRTMRVSMPCVRWYDVVIDQGEAAPRRQPGQIVARPGHEVIHGDDVPALVEEVLTEVRADEPRPARDQDPHRATYERRKGLRPIE